MLPFDDEVLHYLARLSRGATEQDIRKAMEAEPLVLAFGRGDSGEGETLPSDPVVSQQAMSYVAVCEMHGEDGSSVLATTEIGSVFQRVSLPEELGGEGNFTTDGQLPSNLISCFILRRKGDANNSLVTRPLLLRELAVASLDAKDLWRSLQVQLQQIYVPMVRSYARPWVTVRARMQDLVSAIRSLNYTCPEENLSEFVLEDLRVLCATNPTLDVPQLVVRLGALAKDTNYLRQIMAMRNRCTVVLNIDDTLKGEGRAGAPPGSRKDALNWTPTPIVQDTISYWRAILTWIDDIYKQLLTPEWRLTHRLLGHRVETDYTSEYKSYASRVRDYITYLQNITEKRLATEDEAQWMDMMEILFSGVMRPSHYPPHLTMLVLRGIVTEIGHSWIRMATEKNLLGQQDSEGNLSQAGQREDALALVIQHLRTIRSCRDRLQFLQNRFVQSMEILYKQARMALSNTPRDTLEHPMIAALIKRFSTVGHWVEEHYQLISHLRTTFQTRGNLVCSNDSELHLLLQQGAKFTQELEEEYGLLSQRLTCPGASSELSPLWGTSAAEQKQFEEAMQHYTLCVQRCDEQIAQLISEQLATTSVGTVGKGEGMFYAPASVVRPTEEPLQRMFRLYTQFCSIRLEKVHLVLQSYRGAIVEKNRERCKDFQEQYFNVTATKRATRYGIQRLHISPLVARILWEKHLEGQLRLCAVRYDAVAEHGWHQLLRLRNLEHFWSLNEVLAQFIGAPLQDLVTSELKAGSEVHGTAYALAYLRHTFPEDESEWIGDPHLRAAQQLVQSADPASFQAARARLISVHPCRGIRDDVEKLRDIRTTRATITQHIDEKVVVWCQEARKHISQWDTDPDSLILRCKIFRAVESSSHESGEHKLAKGSSSHLVVAFPWQLITLVDDLRFLERSGVLSGGQTQQLSCLVSDFVAANEHRARLAQNIAELLHVYYTTVNADDETLVLLATEEYQHVNECLLRGSDLTWMDDLQLVQYIKSLSAHIDEFATTVQQVRDKTEIIYGRIREFHQRAFHPEALAQRVNEIRRIVNSLSLRCLNAHLWVAQTQPLLDQALLAQLTFLLQGWTYDFVSMRDDPKYLERGMQTDVYHLQPLRVRLCVVYKEVRLETPPTVWRTHWLTELARYVSWLQELPHLLNEDDVRSGLSGDPGAFQLNIMQAGNMDQSHGYSYLMERLPPSVLKAPLQAIERCIQEALEVEREWASSQQFLLLDGSVMQQRWGNDLRQWSRALECMRGVTSQVMDYTRPNRCLGGIVIIAEDAQRELGRKMDQVSQYTYNRFKDVLNDEVQSTLSRMEADRVLAEELNVISSMTDAATFLSEAPRLKQSLKKTQEHILLMQEAETSLRRLGFIFPENWIGVAKVKEEHQVLYELTARKLKALDFRLPFLLEATQGDAATFESKVGLLEAKWKELDVNMTKQSPTMAQHVLSTLHDETLALLEEGQRIASTQEALGAPCINLAKINALLSDTKTRREVWDAVVTGYITLNNLGAIAFFEMVPRRLHEDLTALMASIDAYPAELRRHVVVQDLAQEVTRVLGYRRLMQELRSDVMAPLERARMHWMTLKQELNATWTLEQLTVSDIWKSNPSTHAAIYHGVLDMAQGERRIEVQLHQIVSFWDTFEFQTMVFKSQVVLICGWEAVFEKLMDDLGTFSGMRASPYFGSQDVVALTNDCEQKLTRLHQTLEVLLEVQKRWVYLDGVFSGNIEIRLQLPNEAVLFDRASRDIVKMLPRPKLSGEVPSVRVAFLIDDEKLLPSLERLVSHLVSIQRALSVYLDTQRSRFSRFFFVGDDDLLEILGNSKDPRFISRHLRKMFTALAEFVVEEDDAGAPTMLRGFASAEGEEVGFVGDPVSLRGRTMHEWLRQAESSMVSTLRVATVAATSHLIRDGTVTDAWARANATQIACLALQIWWVQLQEKAFLEKDSIKNTSVSSSMSSLLASLANDLVHESLSSLLRHRYEQLITVAVYQRDASRTLEHITGLSRAGFEWQSLMRLYLTEEVAPRTECRMADAVMEHGFEYLGGYERLVQTPLTDRCYLTLTQALHTRMGGSPVGPAGTGKTETVKALGAQLGRHVLVFNCDDAFDFQSVSRIFLGLCHVGAWGCFDEFNRLSESILSAISQQIQVIHESLRNESGQISLSEHTVPLHRNVAIFITMNPGYAGRSHLPGNLKQLFRTVTMTVPDRETIAEVMLFTQGFHCAEALSKKVVPLFRLCEEQLSRETHYDFGLRALKSVLVSAGDLKRTSVSDNVSTDNTEDAEYRFMLESITNTVVPKLVTSDVTLFHNLLLDFFPHRGLPNLPMQHLRNAVDEVCAETGLTAAPSWTEKICQLYHTTCNRHGIILVGPSGTGKTTAWKALLAALVRIDRHVEAHAYVIEPKVITKGELFGSLDVTTREWRDGVFTSILRKIADSTQQPESAGGDRLATEGRSTTPSTEPSMGLPSNASGFTPSGAVFSLGHQRKKAIHWIIFDGDIDPEWVETLNSVLDDNRVLTLPNGERIALPSNVRILFEVQNVRYATPATVSRSGVVWFSEDVVPLSCALSYAYYQMRTQHVVSSRGSRLTWSMEDDMTGASARNGGANTSSTVTSTRGRTDGRYTFSNVSVHVEWALQQVGGLTACEGPPVQPDMNPTQKDQFQESIGATSDSAALMSTVTGDPHPLGLSRERATKRADVTDAYRIRQTMMEVWGPAFDSRGLIARGIALMGSPDFREEGIMEYNALQLLQSIGAILLEGVWRTYQAEQEGEAALADDVLRRIAEKQLIYAVFWGLGAPLRYDHRAALSLALKLDPIVSGITVPIMDYEVHYPTGEWRAIRERVTETVLRAEQVGSNDTVIPTVDTCRHEDMLRAWISAGLSVILCGPPGSGKTMSITGVLKNTSEYDVAYLNFSSETRADTILKALEQYCTPRNTVHGVVLSPSSGKRLLLFCDEINLPAMDANGTQTVVQLLRQLIERRGFFRTRDNTWITVEDVQVIGACNPPTDSGRVPLSPRVLRWMPVLLVDFPTPESLLTIYTCYCNALLTSLPTLRTACAENLARAMVTFYGASQKRFTPLQQPHYLYSPRELSRWSRAIYEALLTIRKDERKGIDTAGVVRLAVHEGLRIFQDRLVTAEEQEWTDTAIDGCFQDAFPDVTRSAYARPMLYSTLLSPTYSDSPRESLRQLLQERLATFCEDEMVTSLVVFDEMIDHAVRMDRVLHQPLGHMLLAGSSGVGKTSIARLVAWMGGFSAYWLKVHRDYDLEDFEQDLRALLRRAGCKRERICFIFDESNIMQSSFLEYMNALLASGEVPGLFDGDQWPKLMVEIREQIALCATQGSGNAGTVPAVTVNTASEQELYRWFISNVQVYLHVIFTINPTTQEFASRAMTSPALFNRCTIDWLGDWNGNTLRQVALERIKTVKLTHSCHRESTEEETYQKVSDVFCHIHEATVEVNTVLRERHANQGTFITPRHYADCVSHFVKLFDEKRSGSEDQLQHLRSGLKKLHDTSEEVATRQANLRDNEKQLADSSIRAQLMLDKIVVETDTTQKEKAAAEVLRGQLQVEQVRIVEDTKRIEKELSEAEPALQAAEAALNTVKPEYLREIRAYTTPPPMVKRVLEAVLTIMGERNSSDWDTLKGYVRREDFIFSVKAFLPAAISEVALERVESMMVDERFTVEAARHASKAAGPLLQWVFAQIQYAKIYTRVGPMRRLIEQLTTAREAKVRDLEQTDKDIMEKEASLRKLKMEYQTTTEQIAEVKHRIISVAAQCERASTILSQLLDERHHWEEEIAASSRQAETTLGDCILSAAFLAYIGFYDEYVRQRVLLPRWVRSLEAHKISAQPHLSAMEYLVSPAQRLQWERSQLPKDQLCLENATILHRSQRYPLLIDPSGSAMDFLTHLYTTEKITKASFGRPGYLRQLEMAVRFGYPIIIADAELMDPALGPLLNQECHRVGGRRITRIGAQEVDMAPTFKLFLVTRNSLYQPTPDLAGQVCLVNFTITQASLQSQCLQQILLHERPDIDVKRTELLKTHGEYQLRLRVVEQNLLTSIAESEGSLLENNQLIDTLSRLKGESREIQEDIRRSGASLEAILRVERRYESLARVASRMYFALKRFGELSSFYRYDVWFIYNAVGDALAALPAKLPVEDDVLSPTRGVGGLRKGDVATEESDTMEELARLRLLTTILFAIVHRRAVRGMFREDHLTWALRLAQLRSSLGEDAEVAEEEWDVLLLGIHATADLRRIPSVSQDDPNATSNDASLPPVLLQEGVLQAGTHIGRAALLQVLKNSAFKEMHNSLVSPEHFALWNRLFHATSPMEVAPLLPGEAFPSGASEIRKAFLLAVLLYHTRRDSFYSAASHLLRLMFDGRGTSETAEHSPATHSFFADVALDLSEVLPELSPHTPLIMVAAAGGDPSARVEQAARQTGAVLRVVAMGSAEGLEMADRYLTEGVKTGGWLLLINVHLEREYMATVEKRLHHERLESHLHPQFRLFLTAERGASYDVHAGVENRSTIPASLLEKSVVVVYEPPPGMKTSLLQTFGAPATAGVLASSKCMNSGVLRLVFAVAWLHSIVMERLHYVPLGWSHAYEFSDSEFNLVVQASLAWSTGTATSLEVSWEALRTITASTVYGGKIVNSFDQRVLESFCRRVLKADAFRDWHNVQSSTGGPCISPPALADDCNTREGLMKWIFSLPDGSSYPQWADLPSGASRMILSREATSTLERFAIVQGTIDDNVIENVRTGASSCTAVSDLAVPPWSATVQAYCDVWCPALQALLTKMIGHPFVQDACLLLEQIPVVSTIDNAETAVADQTAPLVLAMQREVVAAVQLLRHLVADIEELVKICSGRKKPSIMHRGVIKDLVKGRVPGVWAVALPHIPVQSVRGWVGDVQLRCEHLFVLAEATATEQLHYTFISLGLFFSPGALLTSLKQQSARKRAWPLEQLRPCVEVMSRAQATLDSADGDALYFHDVTLFSASARNDGVCELLQGAEAVSALYTSVVLRWSWSVSSVGVRAGLTSSPSGRLVVPLYTSSQRNSLLEVIEVPVSASESQDVWYERGVCFTSWTPAA